MSINFGEFYQESLALKSELVARRRDFHRHPELAFQETRTASIVAHTLSELGLGVQTKVGKTGVVALLEGAQDGPTVLVRCDMDALPVQEENQTDYASETPGVMHACGHDGHTAIGLAVAKLLSARHRNIAGRIKFVFQPAEEIAEGAAAMIADGVLENPRPDVSLGLHLWTLLPAGKVTVANGPFMAASDTWKCVITGRGGHGAVPNETRDPIVAAAQIIVALQTIVSRNISPLEVGAVSVCELHGGDAFNIIPSQVIMGGTARTFRQSDRELIQRRVVEVCEGVASAMGCEARVKVSFGTPAVNNDPAVAERVREVAATIVGEENLVYDQRTTGSEDMAFLMDDIPGCYFFVGSGHDEPDRNYPHHNSRFDINEDALPIGAAILAGAAASYVLTE